MCVDGSAALEVCKSLKKLVSAACTRVKWEIGSKIGGTSANPWRAENESRPKATRHEALQKDLAKQIGVTEATIYNWERGASRPDYQYMPGSDSVPGLQSTACLSRSDLVNGWSGGEPPWGYRKRKLRASWE
jgi:Helix-turn-helix